MTRDTESVSVARGEQAQLGPLTIENVRYDTVVDWSSFDGWSYFELAIFRTPSP